MRDPSLTPDAPSPAGEVTRKCGVYLKPSGLGSWVVAQDVGVQEEEMALGAAEEYRAVFWRKEVRSEEVSDAVGWWQLG